MNKRLIIIFIYVSLNKKNYGDIMTFFGVTEYLELIPFIKLIKFGIVQKQIGTRYSRKQNI